MRLLVIGASGQVGQALMRVIPRLAPDAAVTGTYRTRPVPGLVPLDAADPAAVARTIAAARPDVILLSAAQADVEWCETHEPEAREANLVPLKAVLASHVPVIGFSSDYVFDGRAGPYAEDAARAPLSAYGRIKCAVEDETLAAGGAIVRTTGVFGIELAPGKNFVLRLIASLRERRAVRVPSDQISTPTFADDLAAAAYRIAAPFGPGVWHAGGPEMCSRVELARAVADAFDLDASLVQPVTTRDLGQKAARPLVGGLRNLRYRATFGEGPVRPVREALEDMRAALGMMTA